MAPPRTRAAYAPPRSNGRIDLKLDGNEGRAPAPEVLERAMRRLIGGAPEAIERYPDTAQLEQLLAQLSGVSRDRIFVGAGADDVLERITRHLSQGGSAVTTPPTFEMIPRYLDEAGVTTVPVAWKEGSFPTERVIEAAKACEADLVFAVSPDNPTGATLTPRDLEALAASLPASLIVLDLVYGEFATVDLQPIALEFENVVVCRSLSKAWGIAGARVGWMIGAPALVDRLRSTGSPYALSAPAIAIACELLSEGRTAIAPYVAEVLRERDLFLDLCGELGLRAQPSEGNFVLVRCENAEGLWRDLASLGIAVRRFKGRPGLEDALRITLPGDAFEFERLAATLRTSQQPRALLFDMDGVLVDVSASFRVAVLETAASFGVPLSSEEVSARKAQGNANDDWELTRSLLEAKGVQATLDEVTERFEALYQGTEGRPGLREQERPLVERSSLERLAKRLPLAVVTGRPRKDAQHFLQREGLEDLFAAVICREDAALKPSPDPVRLACERLGVRSAWMIGDTPDDLTAAREAGVLPLAIAAPGESAEPLVAAGAARVLNSLEDLEGSLS